MTPLNANLDMARSAHSQQTGTDIQNQLASLKGKGLSPEAKEKKLREACEGFESIFIQRMWKEMRKTVHQTTFLHGKEEQFWQDMYDQELAKKMTSAGGIGLANMMYEQLSSHLTSASKTTANALSNERHFVPSAAPLLSSNTKTKEQPIIDEPLKPAAFYEETSSEGPVLGEKNNLAQTNNNLGQGQANINTQSNTNANANPNPNNLAAAGSVDPNVQNALAAMRANVESRSQMSAQPVSINYGSIDGRQQPVASDLHMSNVVRRQAGDQLGSRGVREPLLPQTKTARDATQRAYERREARRNNSQEPNLAYNSNINTNINPNFGANAAVNANPNINGHPNLLPPQAQVNGQPISLNNQPPVAINQPNPGQVISQANYQGNVVANNGQAQAQIQTQAQLPTNVQPANTPNVRKFTYTTNKPQKQQRKIDRNIIRTLNLDGNPKNNLLSSGNRKSAVNANAQNSSATFAPNSVSTVPANPLSANPMQPPVQAALQSPPPYVQPQAQGAQVQPQFQPAIRLDVQKPVAETRQSTDKGSSYSIPPLSATDLRS